MAPICHELNKNNKFEHKILVTGQHKELLNQMLEFFSLTPSYDLEVMSQSCKITDTLVNIQSGLNKIFSEYTPDLVLVHGDTASAMIGCITAFYHNIKIAHIEAGLRSGNLQSPWPEEANRRIISAICSLHFAPTDNARENLVSENIDPSTIFVTGNTVIDALFYTLKTIDLRPSLISDLEHKYPFLKSNKRFLMVTCHRRENFGEPLNNILSAISRIALTQDVNIIIPVHPNPKINKAMYEYLSSYENVYLVSPLNYPEFIFLLSKCYIILSDSGGVQEEAPSLQKPLLLLRDTTERPEAISSGNTILVGTNSENIYETAVDLINDKAFYISKSNVENPFGNGQAAAKIISVIEKYVDF